MRHAWALLLVLAGCASATLRDAQDSFNQGTQGMSSRPRSLEGDAAPSDVLKLPLTHFRRTLELIEEGGLTTSGAAHLAYAALLLQAYSHYSIYRLLPPGEEADGQRGKALAAPFAAAYERIPAEKRPLVRRETALFLLLKTLVRAEDHMRVFDEKAADRASMDRLLEAYQVTLTQAGELLGAGDPDSKTHIVARSPVAEYAVVVICDVAQGALAALDKSSVPPATDAQTAAANQIAAHVHRASSWILGKPATLAALKLRHPRLHARCQELQAYADAVCGGPGLVTGLPR